ncbi:hypothetical protein NPIL_673191 [Nephila pilipes]|uniref:Uncharacterized protein n=1 Tax=Nephila pilipes TaxID=299642 RepID=A0A8X6N2M8_NEPPI|nr:hypothetical protein NPIL_673191 [Nephila pilipes]
MLSSNSVFIEEGFLGNLFPVTFLITLDRQRCGSDICKTPVRLVFLATSKHHSKKTLEWSFLKLETTCWFIRWSNGPCSELEMDLGKFKFFKHKCLLICLDYGRECCP